VAISAAKHATRVLLPHSAAPFKVTVHQQMDIPSLRTRMTLMINMGESEYRKTTCGIPNTLFITCLILFYVSCFFFPFLLFYLCVTVECVGKLHQDLEINLIRIVLILISLPNMPPTISFNAAKMKESHIILGELPL